MKLFFVLALGLILCTGLACQEKKTIVPEFNSERAFGYLEKQVSFGPRVPGSEQSLACRKFFEMKLDSLGFDIQSQAFDFFDPYSQSIIKMTNLVASFEGLNRNEKGIVLVAHYDSRPRTDFAKDSLTQLQPIDGANDGASGCAILLEIAHALSITKPPSNVTLLFVDGEDWGKSGDPDRYLLGAREFARTDIRSRYRFGIVLDMVGDSDLNIYREAYSNALARQLNDMVWGVAAKLGVQSFIDTVKYQVLDDHLPLNNSGVPTIDIIDFDYEFWHTENDSSDKCSAESLSDVGIVILNVLYDESIWPKLK